MKRTFKEYGSEKPRQIGDVDVGWGKPPRHAQFRKGVSGNPKGRPKGSQNLTAMLSTAANNQVTATIAGKPRKISVLQAAVMQLATKAAAGDMRALTAFLDRLDDVENRAVKLRLPEYAISDADLEVIKEVFQRLPPRNKRRGN